MKFSHTTFHDLLKTGQEEYASVVPLVCRRYPLLGENWRKLFPKQKHAHDSLGPQQMRLLSQLDGRQEPLTLKQRQPREEPVRLFSHQGVALSVSPFVQVS